MNPRPDSLFLLFFRVMYLSIFTGYTCFTFLGFAAIGAAIGIAATVVVAVGSEVAFMLARKDKAEKLRQERYLV
jgi:preprotein translocase subunit SecF